MHSSGDPSHFDGRINSSGRARMLLQIESNNRLFRIVAILIALLATGLHVWFGFASSTVLTGDMLEYHTIAVHMIDRGYFGIGGRPDAYVTPVYPLFIAFSYILIHFVTGTPISDVSTLVREFYVYQQILSLTIPLICYLLAKELANRWVGLMAAFLAVAYLPNNFIGSQMFTETIFIPLLLACLLLLVKVLENRSMVLLASTGFVVGTTILTRPTAIVILPVWALFYVFNSYKTRTERAVIWRTAIILITCTMLVLLPWWIRNIVTLHQLVLLSTEGGKPLLLGASPYFQIGQYRLLAMAQGAHETLQQFAIHYIIQGFKHHFWTYLGWYTVVRFPYYFLSPWLLWGWANTSVFVDFHRILVVLGLIATGYSWVNRRIRFVGITLTALLVIQWPFLPICRYVYPVIVVWCSFIPATASVIMKFLNHYKNLKSPHVSIENVSNLKR